jgi:serine protease Do
MQKLTVTRRMRIAALASAALVAAPLAYGSLVENPGAFAKPVPESAPKIVQNGAVSYAPIVAANRPAVVTIKVSGKEQSSQFSMEDLQRRFGGEDSPFNDFLKRFFEEGPGMQQGRPDRPRGHRMPQTTGLGSGFIVDGNGTIVTNNHVIDGASEITVILDDETELKATLVGTDPKTDLAVLKVDAGRDLPSLNWGVSQNIEPGDPVLAIGNPFGIGTTVTSGIVSARGRDLRSGPYDDFLQVDAPINRGNSGGPLFSVDGKVIGVNTAIYSPNGGNVGVAFAIPSDQARLIVEQLIEDGSIERGYIGVQIQPVTKEVAEAVGLANAEGAIVAQVDPATPAGKAGVKSGDVVTKFGATAIDSPKALARVVADVKPGTKETLTVWRQGKEVILDVTVGNMKDQQVAGNDSGDQSDPSATDGSVDLPDLGIKLTDLTDDMRESLGLGADATGAIVSQVDEGSAADRGITEGDIVVSVNQEPVASAAAARDAIAAAKKEGKKSVLLLVQRKDGQNFVALPFAQS